MPNEHEAQQQQEPDDKDLEIASLTGQVAEKAQQVAQRDRMIFRQNQKLTENAEIIDSLSARVAELTAMIPDEPTKKEKTK